MMVCSRQGWANAVVASAMSRGADYVDGCITSEARFLQQCPDAGTFEIGRRTLTVSVYREDRN